MKTSNILLTILIVVFIILTVGVFRNHIGVESSQNSILNEIQKTKIIRVGYAAYPPYVIKDLKTGELSGYDVDIVNEMATRMGVKVEWVETTWQTFVSDLQTGKFDLLGVAAFETVPRWEQISFTSPLGYFVGVAGLTKKGENRFQKIEDLNQKGITISVPQGWNAQFYADKYLSRASIKSFPGDTPALAIADAVTGNSDVALADGPSMQQYLEQNSNQNMKVLFIDNPVEIDRASLGVRKGDIEWLTFLNGAIETMRADGTLKSIAKKYHLYSYDIETNFVPQ